MNQLQILESDRQPTRHSTGVNRRGTNYCGRISFQDHPTENDLRQVLANPPSTQTISSLICSRTIPKPSCSS